MIDLKAIKERAGSAVSVAREIGGGEVLWVHNQSAVIMAKSDIPALISRVEELEKVINAHGVHMGVIKKDGAEILVVGMPPEPGTVMTLPGSKGP